MAPAHRPGARAGSHTLRPQRRCEIRPELCCKIEVDPKNLDSDQDGALGRLHLLRRRRSRMKAKLARLSFSLAWRHGSKSSSAWRRRPLRRHQHGLHLHRRCMTRSHVPMIPAETLVGEDPGRLSTDRHDSRPAPGTRQAHAGRGADPCGIDWPAPRAARQAERPAGLSQGSQGPSVPARAARSDAGVAGGMSPRPALERDSPGPGNAPEGQAPEGPTTRGTTTRGTTTRGTRPPGLLAGPPGSDSGSPGEFIQGRDGSRRICPQGFAVVGPPIRVS